MQIEEYRKYWGGNRLCRWPPESLSGVTIPEASKAFLQDVGMPKRDKRDAGGSRFEWDLTLPIYEAGRHVLGRTRSHPVLVDEATGGAVVLASYFYQHGSPPGVVPERWLNSSIEMFAAVLTEHHRLRNRKPPYTWDPDYAGSVGVFELRLAEIDPPAMTDRVNYWPSVALGELPY